MSILMHKSNIHKATRPAFSAAVDEDVGQMITRALHILFFPFVLLLFFFLFFLFFFILFFFPFLFFVFA